MQRTTRSPGRKYAALCMRDVRWKTRKLGSHTDMNIHTGYTLHSLVTLTFDLLTQGQCMPISWQSIMCTKFGGVDSSSRFPFTAWTRTHTDPHADTQTQCHRHHWPVITLPTHRQSSTWVNYPHVKKTIDTFSLTAEYSNGLIGYAVNCCRYSRYLDQQWVIVFCPVINCYFIRHASHCNRRAAGGVSVTGVQC